MRLLLALLLSLACRADIAKVQSANAGGLTGTLTFTTSATTVGNLLVACTNHGLFGTARTISAPDGTWNRFDDISQTYINAVGWWKVVTSSATSYTFTVSEGSEYTSGVIVEFSGTRSAQPVNQHATQQQSGGSTTPTPASATPSVIGTLPVACLATDDGSITGSDVTGVSSNWTVETKNRPNYHAIYVALRTLTTDTTTAMSNQFTLNSNGQPSINLLLLLQPAPAVRRRPIRW